MIKGLKLRTNEHYEILTQYVNPGEFVKYYNDIPTGIEYTRNIIGAHTNVVIVCVDGWNLSCGNISSNGNWFLTDTTRDDLDLKGQNFNRNTIVTFKDASQNVWRYNFYSIDHRVGAACTGTSLSVLNSAFKMPDYTYGSVLMLENCQYNIKTKSNGLLIAERPNIENKVIAPSWNPIKLLRP